LIVLVSLWLRGAPRRLALSVPLADAATEAGDTRLRTGSVVWAVLVKDLRTASRTPGYAFLILIPLLDSLALGLSTYIQTLSGANALNLASAAVVTAALLATFFGPAFFAIEVMGYSYTRTLPIRQRSLMGGKVALIVSIYLVASALVLGLTLLRIAQPLVFLAFVLAEFPAVAGAAITEIGLLFLIARRRGLPIVNLYTGAWWAIVVGIPGIFMAGLPYVLFVVLSPSGPGMALLAMALSALVGLGIGLTFTLGFAVREPS
jgi:predicted permease